MYSETITLFNRYHSRIGDMWYPHILHNVDLIIDKASANAKYGAETTDSASLHIKCANKGGTCFIEDVPYLQYKAWAKLTNDRLAEYITFSTDATYFDFFYVGEYDNLDPISDKAYTDGFYAYMESNYECYAITSASSPYKLIPHFELTAR